MIAHRLRTVWSAHPRFLAAGLIVATGLAWLLVDIVTDDDPAATGDVYDRIDAYVQDELEDSRIPGAAIAVVDDGRTVHAAGYGRDGRGNPITADTPFWIGSNTKSITALAVMQLVDDGLIDLDAPVRRYLPDFELADEKASGLGDEMAITVRHLLNQTSGIARIDGIRAVAAGRDQSMTDTVADMADLELNRPVGDSFEYSNLNSVLLGVIVETVTGQSWEDVVAESIFDPLAMDSTFTDRESAEAAGLTTTYRSFFGFPLQTEGQHLGALAATGYVYSTADDMARYLAMYTNGGMLDGQRLLSEASVDDMLLPATGERTVVLQSQSFTAAYGAGWFVGSFGRADDARWHQGSLPHFTAWMVLLPDTDQGVVVLLNEGNQFDIGGANAAWSRIPQGIVNLLRGEDPPTGTGGARFFIVFITIVVAAAVSQVMTLVGLVRNGLPDRPMWRTCIPLIWEIGLSGLVLLAYPGAVGGLGWSTAFAFLPDLTFTVIVVGGLAVTTGAVRIALLIQSRRGAASRQFAVTTRPPGADRTGDPEDRSSSTGRAPLPVR